MAHTVNYAITDYAKIWKDITPLLQSSDLAFANIEAPIDTTKKHSSWPNFNMTYNYVNASITAGFNVFSLCNNHTNDQGLTGIQETAKTTKALQTAAKNQNKDIYFSGIKNSPKENFSYNLIEKNGWKVLFLPITELLNRPDFSAYINFSKPTVEQRQKIIELCKELKTKTKCDLFIFSLHTAEPEYTRKVTDAQEEYYMNLLNAGVDIVTIGQYIQPSKAHLPVAKYYTLEEFEGLRKLAEKVGIKTILVNPMSKDDLLFTKFFRILEKGKFKKFKKMGILTKGKYYE